MVVVVVGCGGGGNGCGGAEKGRRMGKEEEVSVVGTGGVKGVRGMGWGLVREALFEL